MAIGPTGGGRVPVYVGGCSGCELAKPRFASVSWIQLQTYSTHAAGPKMTKVANRSSDGSLGLLLTVTPHWAHFFTRDLSLP